MPELPEVETVKNVLLPIVKGHTIQKIDILRKSIIHSDINKFVKGLEGETFVNITRIGKFLIFHLTNDKTFRGLLFSNKNLVNFRLLTFRPFQS